MRGREAMVWFMTMIESPRRPAGRKRHERRKVYDMRFDGYQLVRLLLLLLQVVVRGTSLIHCDVWSNDD
jgi:hypothetical protein